MEVVVEQGQSLRDIALQNCGDISALIDLAWMNDLSITDDISAGTVLQLPEVVNQDVVSYFKSKRENENLIPATGNADDSIELEGIGYWYIGLNFKVS